MKLYSQIGVSSSRNSPYFLYKSYVTCRRSVESQRVTKLGASYPRLGLRTTQCLERRAL